MPTIGEISLYLHVPFCTKKCPYCHFYVVADRPSLRDLYLSALQQEWERLAPLLEGRHLVSIYWGGGTPSLLGPDCLKSWISQILAHCKSVGSVSNDIEITLEANPEQLHSLDLLQAFREAGVSRLSLGVQSLDPELLQRLGRSHSAEQAIQAIHWSHEAGISQLSIDLMYELPGQTLVSWEKTLEQLPSLPITHLSLYNLTIEPNTSFHRHKETLVPQLPTAETNLQMLEQLVTCCAAIGLERYEISAFARPGCRARHNLGYWQGREFLGLGPSAFSFWQGARKSNVANLVRYAEALKEGRSPIDFEECLPYPDNLRERLAIALRVLEGVHLDLFASQQGYFPPELDATLLRLEQEGFLERCAHQLRLTPRGALFYDHVGAEIAIS